MVTLSPKSAQETAAIAKVVSWLQERLVLDGRQLDRSKLKALLAEGITLDDVSETRREELSATKLKVVGFGMRMVSIPVGTERFEWQSVAKVMRGDPTELLQFIPVKDAQAAFQII